MAGLDAYALICSLINLVANLLPEVKNTTFAPSSSSSTQAQNAHSIEADLGWLARKLERIKVTLYDAEERDTRDKSIRLWMKEIKELGLEAEYILEEYMYEVNRARVEARNASNINQEKCTSEGEYMPEDEYMNEVHHAQVECRDASKLNTIKEDINANAAYSVEIPYGMVDRIRNIKSRFAEIENDRKSLHLREEDAPRRKKIRFTFRPTSPIVMEKSVFGREEEKEKVINSLHSEGNIISVLPIIGKGGIGKTTMAQLIYNDKRVQGFFDMMGWLYVSDDFNTERIIRDIIVSFTRKPYSLKNQSVQMEELANIVKQKTIFLVLDDMWNEEKYFWESLRMCLMRATKATIVVTTRNVSVARVMQTMDPLQLEYLSEEKCWLLFTHYAFQGMDLANQAELIGVGMKIVNKCGGLPLAIKLIGSLLSQEKELHSWFQILKSDLW